MGPLVRGHRTNTGYLDVLGSPSTLIGLQDPPASILMSRLSTKSDLEQKIMSDNRFMVRSGKPWSFTQPSTAVKKESTVPKLRYMNNFV